MLHIGRFLDSATYQSFFRWIQGMLAWPENLNRKIRAYKSKKSKRKMWDESLKFGKEV